MIRQLDIPIYDANVLFLLDVKGEEFAEFLDNKVNKSKINESEIKEIFDDIANDKWDGTLFRLNNGGNYVSLIKKADDVRNYSHELFHIADQILKDRGVEYTENNEALAYLVGWLNVQYGYILQEFNKNNGQEKLWKDAEGDDLPVYDREVIVLIQDYSDDHEHLRVCYGHRPNPKGYVSIDGEEVYAQTYGKGGWNGKNVRWWLDVKLPNEE